VSRVDPTVDETTALLLAAAVGAGGAIVGQLVTAALGQRAANRRLAWERHGRFADVQRALFAQLLNLHWEFHRQCMASGDTVEADYDRNLESTGTLVNEIALLAPDLAAVVGALEAAAAEAYSEISDMRNASPPLSLRNYAVTEPYRETIEVCREEMAKHLNGPD
jgi:roadblock/LC7 domain-containing protein